MVTGVKVSRTPKDGTQELSTKERKFCEAYLGSAAGNGAMAARMAGYKHERQVATRLLTYVHVRDYIDRTLHAESLRAAEVLHELSEVARADWRDFLQVRTRNGEVIDARMDLQAKVKALELLGKYHRLWEQDGGGSDRQAPVVVNINTVPARLRPEPAEVTVETEMPAKPVGAEKPVIEAEFQRLPAPSDDGAVEG